MPNPGDEITVGNALLDSWPIGICYTQYPGTPAPNTLLGGTWTNISSNFPGLFFRAEGGNASTFNSGTQTQDVLPHTHTFSGQTGGQSNDHAHHRTVYGGGTGGSGDYVNPVINPGAPYDYPTGGTTSDHSHAYSGTTSQAGSAENRPANQTIRVWQRTA